jgi:cobalt-zinc-cadmium efflux system outer membrane protein
MQRFFLLPFILLCIANANAQSNLSLADAVADAIVAHPQLAAGSARIAAAEGVRQQVGLAPNPRLIVQLENTRFWESPAFSFGRDTDDYAFFAQLIETGGKRARRVDFATAGVRRVEAERQILASQITSRVSTAYWAALGACRVRDLLQQEVDNFDRIVQYHRDRVREGAMAEVNLLRVQLERQRLSVSAKSAAQEADRATITIFREMGKAEFPPVLLTEGLEVMRAVEVTDVAQALDRRPEMRLARQAIDQARSNLRLQQANAKPDIDMHLGYKRTLGFDTLYTAVQVPLPFRNRNQGQIGAASAELRAAEATLAATEAQVRADVEIAGKDYEARRRLVIDTLRPMQDQAGEVSRIAQAAYREGGFDLLRLLDSERTRLEAQILYARTLADYQQSVVMLQIALGSLP